MSSSSSNGSKRSIFDYIIWLDQSLGPRISLRLSDWQLEVTKMSSSRPVKSPFRPSRARITFLSFSRCRVGETPRRCDIIQAINSEAAASSESWSWLLMHERSSLFVSFHWVLSCELRVVIEILATVGKWHSFAVPRSPSHYFALAPTPSHSFPLLHTPSQSPPVGFSGIAPRLT